MGHGIVTARRQASQKRKTFTSTGQGRAMHDRCINPYCTAVDPKLRPPTPEELLRWRAEAEEQHKGLMEGRKLSLSVCVACGVWIVEVEDQERGVTHVAIPPPFRFAVGERVRVVREGDHLGKVGTIQRRMRKAKLVMPPPVPENYYYLVFEMGQLEESYHEVSLERAC